MALRLGVVSMLAPLDASKTSRVAWPTSGGGRLLSKFSGYDLNATYVIITFGLPSSTDLSLIIVS